VRGDELVVMREPGRIKERVPLAAGEERPWDGRFLVAHRAGGVPVEVAELGRVASRMLPRACRVRLRSARVPEAAVAALPAFRQGGRLVACPPLAAYGMVPEAGFCATIAARPALALGGPAFAGVNVVSKTQRLI